MAKLEWVHETKEYGDNWTAEGQKRHSILLDDDGMFFRQGCDVAPKPFPTLADAKAWCQSQEDAAAPVELPTPGDVWEVPGRKSMRRLVHWADGKQICFAWVGNGAVIHEQDQWQSWVRDSGAVRIDGEGERVKELIDKWRISDHEIEQILGKALGYPRYIDDQKNFPGSTGDDVCVGEHVAVTLASEVAARVTALERELSEAKAAVANLESECESLRNEASSEGQYADGVKRERDNLAARLRESASWLGDVHRRIGPGATNDWIRQEVEKVLRKLQYPASAQSEVVKERDELRIKLDAEKVCRVYYQDIVYWVCGWLDRLRGGQPTVCGSASEPCDGVQRALADVLAKWQAVHGERDEARRDVATAQRQIRAAVEAGNEAGWNGVDNPKCLGAFIMHLREERDDARAAVSRLLEALRGIEETVLAVDTSTAMSTLRHILIHRAREARLREEGVKS